MSEKLSFTERAGLSTEHPLLSYLYYLISVKQTNLCVSADVNSTTALLRLAEEVGDYICVLKTHADIVDDFGPRTIKGLVEISKRKRFLIFEDRKFGDIGSMTSFSDTISCHRISANIWQLQAQSSSSTPEDHLRSHHGRIL